MDNDEKISSKLKALARKLGIEVRARYGKPDIVIYRRNGKVVVGDAKTGAKKEWHWLQNRVALQAICQPATERVPFAALLKYASDDEVLRFDFTDESSALSPDEQDLLAAVLEECKHESSRSVFVPSQEECRFCPFSDGCPRAEFNFARHE